MKKRFIEVAEVEYALNNPRVTLPGKNKGTKRIIADMAFGRKLSVVYKPTGKGSVLVITAYWVEGQP